jgi:hypothetical protein
MRRGGEVDGRADRMSEEEVKSENEKYAATIRKMSNSLAVTCWNQLDRNDQAAWLFFTKPYSDEMAKCAYHAERREAAAADCACKGG